jgi:multidrug resistance efflux pump
MEKHYKSYDKIFKGNNPEATKRWLIGIFIAVVIIMCLPWTQTVTGNGQLISLQPEQRPQTIQTVIPGRIEKWFVQEGQLVHKGDTILFLSEVKDDYFDPNLLDNVQNQIMNKESSVKSYMQKVEALDTQIDALNQNRELKLQQQELKIKQTRLKLLSDSSEFRAASANYKVAQEQVNRFKQLHSQGLVSQTELEQREVVLQNARAKMIDTENKLLISRQEIINLQTEVNTLRADFKDKISKAESDKYTALSAMYDAEGTVTKLQNTYTNYSMRIGMYYITSPQDGYITRALKSGIGETIKEGTEIVSIMPYYIDLAVEMYVEPIDLPLMAVGESVRFTFDGWPAIVFSGWPGASHGTYGGTVRAIDNFISPNGKYRIVVVPDQKEQWPSGLRVGTGANGFALLRDVPIGYELWRQFNGFPPDFYAKSNEGYTNQAKDSKDSKDEKSK